MSENVRKVGREKFNLRLRSISVQDLWNRLRQGFQRVNSRMSLLQNAMSSIEMGLEDFSSGKKERLLSAVRNLHSGILLLFKEKLVRLSPPGSSDVLIMRKFVPKLASSGAVEFVGVGKETVTVQEIRERFQSLGIKAEWARIETITKLRNDVEHKFTSQNPDAIRGAISDTFAIVRDFLTNELATDPKDVLDADAFNTLLSVSEVFEAEKAACGAKMDAIDWKSAALKSATEGTECTVCFSPLLVPFTDDREGGVECRSCSEIEDFEPFAERALANHLDPLSHMRMMDGGEPVLISCPFCFRKGYVLEEQRCAICEEACCHECDLCGNGIPSSELSDGSVCAYCDYKFSKDD